MPFWITAENAASVLNISERKLASQSTTIAPLSAASEDRSCAIERGTFAFERSSDAVRLRLEREHEERSAARSRKLKVESRVAGYQAKWANSTPSGRAFDSLPLVSDTTELDNVLRKNRTAFLSGVASAGRF